MPPGFAAPGGGATPPPSPGAGMKVTGIMGSRTRVAIIEADGKTHIVGVGERVGDAVVVSILPEKVIMKQHNVTFELDLGGDRSS
jgi:flagellar biogenesis protein FliO